MEGTGEGRSAFLFHRPRKTPRKMFGGDNNNPMFTLFPEAKEFQFNSNASTQLQLVGNFGCNVEPVNYISNEHISNLNRPSKRNKEAEDMSRRQKLQISLNNFFQDDVDANVISTGLRLSYDDDERNSSVTSASENMSTLPVVLSGDNLRTEIESQEEELNRYIRVQEESMAKGVKEIRQRHMATSLSLIEGGVGEKLREKELEIETMNRKNGELVEKIKQVAAEAQSWQYRAQYNESVVNELKDSLKRAMAQGADRVKEGCGDSEVDDAVSSFNHQTSIVPGVWTMGTPRGISKAQLTCRSCRIRVVSMLFLPCRHICLCADCDGFIDVCPTCQVVKTTSIQVFMS